MNQWQFQMFQQQFMQQQTQQQQQQMWLQFPIWLQQNQLHLQPQIQQSQQGFQKIFLRGKPIESISLGSGQNIINLTMIDSSTGHKVVIAASADTTIKNLLKIYIKKIGLNLNVIGKDFMFAYNGTKLDDNSHQSIGSIFRNNGVISVYDISNIIGA